MARRAKKHVIDKKMIIDAFAEMAKDKSIDRDLLQAVLEETLSMIVRKKYGAHANFEIIVNMEKGDIEIYLTKEVVDEVEDPIVEISVEEANQFSEEKLEDGDDFIEEITLNNISDSFGRRLISLAGQNLNQRIRDIERDNIYNAYISKVNDILIGEIYQIRRQEILMLDNKVELHLPRREQIPNEQFRNLKNQSVKVLVKEVNHGASGNQPEIIVSRACNEFMSRLFEIEIPEIYDGIIEIKGIARDPGERAKVAVISFDDRVDPVGACVGMRGIRIHSIVRELNNENIDLIEYSENPAIYIERALAPAKIKSIDINQETNTANVIVTEDQVSLAIGKNGQNVKLASSLTGFNISLEKEGGEDIDLFEFKEELGIDIYEEIFDLGYETARDFLEGDIDAILAVEGMNKDLLLELRQIMLQEFDESESQVVLEKIEKSKAHYEPGEDTSKLKDVDDLIEENKVEVDKDLLNLANI